MRSLGQLVIRLREIVERMKEDAAATSVTVHVVYMFDKRGMLVDY